MLLDWAIANLPFRIFQNTQDKNRHSIKNRTKLNQLCPGFGGIFERESS
jgi:hypothetical protein